MTSRAYVWLSTNGGTWSVASNWDDVTDGIDPSLTVPGINDSVTVVGPSGASVQTIAGPGAAAFASLSGNTRLSGAFTFTSLMAGAGGAGGLLEFLAHDSLSAGTATIASGSLLCGGTATVSGTLTVGQAGAGAATLYATSGGSVQAAALDMGNALSAITIDPTAHVEVGNTGGAAAGALTVDAGSALAGQGDANAYGAVVNNGLITAQGGTLSLGSLTGTGTLDVAAAATLELNGRTGAGQSIDITGALATLAIATEFDAPAGSITGFAPGDAIDELGSPITGASFSQTGTAGGVLTLSYGSQTADTLYLAGNFTGDVFLPSADGAGGTDITVAPAVVSTGGASPGTSTPDDYIWTAAGAGAWNVAANWQDSSRGTGTAAIAPGVNDLVTITGGAHAFLVVAGPGNAASLAVAGALALSGAENIGTLSIGTASAPAVLDLMAGAAMAAQAATVVDGALDVSGQGARFADAGTLLLGGGILGVGLPTAALNASNGASVTLGGLTMGGGSGASVTTDPTSSIVISFGTGTAGAVTVTASGTLSGNGSVNPFGNIIDNGLIDATGAGGTLTLGTLTGSGTLAIAAGATLELMTPTALPIDFAAQSGSLSPSLDLVSELALPTGTLSGFGPGDVIDILGDPITSVSVVRNTTSPSIITLFYGSTVVGRLSLLGGFAHDVFVAEPDASDGTDIVVVQQAGGGGGGGTGTTDTLEWAIPGSGSWSRASNWNDLTTGAVATVAPGTENQVIVDGPTGGSVQSLGGPGTCSSLEFTGNTLLNGAFAATTLTIGTASAAGTLDAIGADVLTATTATLAYGELSLTGAGTDGVFAGTLTIGGIGTALLTVSGTASVQAGALVLEAGAAVSIDATSSMEVGTLGGAAAGALTIDPGCLVSGAGTLNAAGAIIDNGTLSAQGGTLTIGTLSGAGTLDIGTEATLVLATADPAASACQIVFAGGGATLEFEAALTAGAIPCIIAGFAAGDAIVSASAPVTSVAFTQGTTLGTLTLSYGSQPAATLLLGGNFAGDIFAVQPDGTGSEVTVTPTSGGTGPSAGTTTPDDYVWTGTLGDAWNIAANWDDTSASQTPALVAPGLNDLVTITGASGSGFLTVEGPADAASLALSGNVALSGNFSAGTLAVGAGILALGTGTALSTGTADATGGIELQGASLAVAGTLDLAGGTGSVLVADGQSSVSAAELDMEGGAVLADATSSIVVGGTSGGAGELTVDAGGRVSGAGALDILGTVADDGTIIAAGGTLSLGAVSGDGTLLIGQGATLVLDGSAGSGVIIDFAANGTLSASVTPAAAIAGFGTSDAILLPFADAAGATYAATAPGTGVLTITGASQDGESQVLGVLTLLGMNAGSQFSVTGAAGGGTLLTTTTAQNGSSGGGSTVSGATTTGGQYWDTDNFIASEPSYAQQALDVALAGLSSWVFVSPDGSFDGAFPEFGYANVALVSDPADDPGDDPQPYAAIWMPYGYHILIASGNTPLYLVDATGDSLIIGNAGKDSITGLGQNETMIGGAGANTDFWASGTATMVGGGNDIFVAQNGAVNVTTSTNGESSVWLGAANNYVTLNGSDTVSCGGTGIADDTVVSAGSAAEGSLVVGPDLGAMTYQCGAGPASIVGHDGALEVYGAGGQNLVIGGTVASSSCLVDYIGGTGGALVVGEAGMMYVVGGAGALTVFGGVGEGNYSAEAGPSYFVVGDGPTTISASSGNVVWLEGGADVVTSVNGGGVIAWGVNSSGDNTFEAGTGPCTLAGGMGSNLFMAGTGNATLAAGSGGNIFSFTDGSAGGNDDLQNFVIGRDKIALQGYSETPAAILATETVSGGGTSLLLNDGTHITLVGVTGLTAASFTT